MKPTFFKVLFRGEELLLVGVEGSHEGVLITPDDYRAGGDGVAWVGEDGTISVFGVPQEYTIADLKIVGPAPDPTEGMTDEQVEGLINVLVLCYRAWERRRFEAWVRETVGRDDL